MDELRKLLHDQYVREFKVRKTLAILFAFTALAISYYGYFVMHESTCIFIITTAFAIVTLLPPPKGWQNHVRKNSRRPVFATVKCVGALILYIIGMTKIKFAPAPISSFGFLLSIYGSSITPYLENIKKKQ